MNWKNLLKDKCPKCGKNLRFLLVERIWGCGSRKPPCDFFISDSRKNDVCAEMVGIPKWKRITTSGGVEPVNPDIVKAKINSKRAEAWKYKPQ